MTPDWLTALWGGAVIGLAVSIMLLFNGRVTGISGIINGFLEPQNTDRQWRSAFLLGLFAGGMTLQIMRPESFGAQTLTHPIQIVAAGLLVGFGSLLGSGCTSGHAVCGISRLSPRSILATVIFIATGIITVALSHFWMQP